METIDTVTRKNLLIDPSRVEINPYFLTWVHGFRLAGFIFVTPYTAPPPYKTWDNPPYNRFCNIAAEAKLDGKPAFVLPVFVNDEPHDYRFDSDVEPVKPAAVFFLGNDDSHYALRFNTFSERDAMIKFFGEDLGFLDKDLIYHN